MEEKFREIFEKSPIGIIFLDKEGQLTDANSSTLKIMGYPSLNDVMGLNSFKDLYIAPKKDELLEKGHIKIQSPIDFDNIKKSGIYKPTRSGTAFLDLTISVIDSGFLVQIQDISEQKKAEDAEELLKVLMDNNPSLVFMKDENGKYVYLNKSYEKRFVHSKDWYGKTDFDFWPKESAELFQANDLKVLKSGRIQQFLEDSTDLDGTRHCWLNYKFPFTDTKNEKYVGGIGIDVTGRILAEEALRLSEEKYRRIIETSQEGIVIAKPEGDYTFVNQKMVNMLGYSEEELLGKSSTDFMCQEDQRTQVLKAREDLGQESISGEFKFCRKDGSILWTHYNATPIFDDEGNHTGNFVMHTDITKRKKAEEALMENEKLYRTLFENTDDAFQVVELIYDKKGNVCDFRYLKTNRAFEQQSGLKTSDIIGKTVKKVLPNVEPYWFEMYDKVIKESKPIHDENYNQDTERWYDMFYFPYSKCQVGVIFRDITQQKKADEELKEAIKELKRSNQELQQFAYVSSHDLQEPLRTIASFTQLLEKRYKGKFDSDADEFMEFIVEAAIRMKAQIEGLLEYSRVARGKEFKPVDMNKILNQTIKALNTSIEESKAKITFDELPTVMGDTNQLQRVFQNLISNAIIFRKCEEPLIIHISSNKDIYNKEYVFSIKDNGIGIEEQYSERIFTIFQRLHTRNVYKGTGIGLSIVKRVIEHHGGHIWVESELGVGSIFYFTLPIFE